MAECKFVFDSKIGRLCGLRKKYFKTPVRVTQNRGKRFTVGRHEVKRRTLDRRICKRTRAYGTGERRHSPKGLVLAFIGGWVVACPTHTYRQSGHQNKMRLKQHHVAIHISRTIPTNNDGAPAGGDSRR